MFLLDRSLQKECRSLLVEFHFNSIFMTVWKFPNLAHRRYLFFTTVSDRHNLLLFCLSDLDKIWYAPFLCQCVWTFFSIFSIKGSFLGTLQLGQKPTLSIRHDLWPFCPSDLVCALHTTICIDIFCGFYNFFGQILFFQTLLLRQIVALSVRHDILPFYSCDLDQSF